jgi:hypothetical protein
MLWRSRCAWITLRLKPGATASDVTWNWRSFFRRRCCAEFSDTGREFVHITTTG